jgi:hypothetical protein
VTRVSGPVIPVYTSMGSILRMSVRRKR